MSEADDFAQRLRLLRVEKSRKLGTPLRQEDVALQETRF